MSAKAAHSEHSTHTNVGSLATAATSYPIPPPSTKDIPETSCSPKRCGPKKSNRSGTQFASQCSSPECEKHQKSAKYEKALAHKQDGRIWVTFPVRLVFRRRDLECGFYFFLTRPTITDTPALFGPVATKTLATRTRTDLHISAQLGRRHGLALVSRLLYDVSE